MRTSFRILFASIAFALFSTLASTAVAAEEAPAAASANHAILNSTLGGTYFVAKPLKEEYDRLLGRLEVLRSGLEQGQISGNDARSELVELQTRLTALREEIAAKKVLVATAKVETQSETIEFAPGAERLLVVTADQVRIVGWEGPNIKCVLEKTVLSGRDQTATDEFTALKLVHAHQSDPGVVGKTHQEREAEEQAFLNSEQARALTAEQREEGLRFRREIAASYDRYGVFQGKEIDLLRIEGLTHQEGNRNIETSASSEGGEAIFGGEWRRHAGLTIYVPQLTAVAIRGCGVGIDVQGLHASLLLTGADSQNRDYGGEFRIQGVQGDVVVDNTRIQLIERVQGNTTIVGTVEFANAGTTHADDKRLSYTYPASNCTCKDLQGDLTAWFGRVQLRLEGITGRIDIRNDFGDTEFVSGDQLQGTDHRILSHSGRIQATLAKGVPSAVPVSALTESGVVETNAASNELEDISFTADSGPSAGRRNWRGFITPRDRNATVMLDFERTSQVLDGAHRSPGLDLISRAGRVDVTLAE